MQIRRLIYYSLSAVHVSDDIFVRHQEHLTVFTASGTIHQCRCRLVSWMTSVGRQAKSHFCCCCNYYYYYYLSCFHKFLDWKSSILFLY